MQIQELIENAICELEREYNEKLCNINPMIARDYIGDVVLRAVTKFECNDNDRVRCEEFANTINKGCIIVVLKTFLQDNIVFNVNDTLFCNKLESTNTYVFKYFDTDVRIKRERLMQLFLNEFIGKKC